LAVAESEHGVLVKQVQDAKDLTEEKKAAFKVAEQEYEMLRDELEAGGASKEEIR
jgi:hypothetical protein